MQDKLQSIWKKYESSYKEGYQLEVRDHVQTVCKNLSLTRGS